MSSLDVLPLSKLDRILMESAHNRELRDHILRDPASVLRDAGYEVAENPDIQVIEDDMNTHHIVLPPFVGTEPAPESLRAQLNSDPSTWWCTTCTPTSPICAGSLASLTCA